MAPQLTVPMSPYLLNSHCDQATPAWAKGGTLPLVSLVLPTAVGEG